FNKAVWSGPPTGNTCPANTPLAAAGDIEVAMISTLNYTAGVNVSVTAPSGWTLIPAASCSDGGKDQQQNLFYHVVGNSEPASYTWTINNPWANACDAIIADYSNV